MVIGVSGESGVNALRVVEEERREAQENATTQLQLTMAILVQEKLSKMKTVISNPAQACTKLRIKHFKNYFTVDGGWCEWERKWTDCSASCGGGVRQKTRECRCPALAHAGQPCAGDKEKKETCNVNPCPGINL